MTDFPFKKNNYNCLPVGQEFTKPWLRQQSTQNQ